MSHKTTVTSQALVNKNMLYCVFSHHIIFNIWYKYTQNILIYAFLSLSNLRMTNNPALKKLSSLLVWWLKFKEFIQSQFNANSSSSCCKGQINTVYLCHLIYFKNIFQVPGAFAHCGLLDFSSSQVSDWSSNCYYKKAYNLANSNPHTVVLMCLSPQSGRLPNTTVWKHTHTHTHRSTECCSDWTQCIISAGDIFTVSAE